MGSAQSYWFMKSWKKVWYAAGWWASHKESNSSFRFTHTPSGIPKLSMSQYWAHESLVHTAQLAPQSIPTTQFPCKTSLGEKGWSGKQKLTTRETLFTLRDKSQGWWCKGSVSGELLHSLRHYELERGICFLCRFCLYIWFWAFGVSGMWNSLPLSFFSSHQQISPYNKAAVLRSAVNAK